MAGYTRVDTSNNIADGNVIAAADLDNEFDGVQAAFSASTGHTHGGAVGEGAPIVKLGPTNDVTISATLLAPKTTNTVDIGSSSLKYKDLWLAGNASIAGTLAVTGVATLTAQPVLSSLTASSAVATDASKGLVSVTNTGTGNNVLATSPTLVTPALGTPSSGVVTNLTGTASININGTVGATTASTGAFTTLAASGAVTLSGGTANGVAYLNGSKVLTSGSALTFDGTTLGSTGGVKATGPAASFAVDGGTLDYTASLTRLAAGRAGGNYAEFQLYVAGASGITKRFSASYDTTFQWFGSDGTSEQMRLTSTGLGIGTSSPATKLHVNSGAAGYGITIAAASQTSITYQLGIDSNSNLAFYDTNAAAQRLVLSQTGNLGLGVTPSVSYGREFSISADLGAGVSGLGVRNLATANNVLYISNNAKNTGAFTDSYWVTSNATKYVQQSGTHVWYNAPVGTAGNAITFTQAMTLDASGKLVVGATAALGSSTGTFVAADDVSAICAATTNGQGVFISSNSTARFVTYNSSGPLSGGHIWQVGNTEVARLDLSGNLLVGATSAISNIRLRVSGGGINVAQPTSSASGSNTIADNGSSPNTIRFYNDTDSNNSTNRFIICDAAASVLRAEIRSNGGIANYSGNNVNLSDRREKTNFAPAKSYLETICAIPVQTFNYIDQNMEDDGGLTLGVVAQDVQAVAPELVMESNWGTQDEPKQRLSIYQTDLQYALMKSIQELKAEFDAYKSTHP